MVDREIHPALSRNGILPVATRVIWGRTISGDHQGVGRRGGQKVERRVRSGGWGGGGQKVERRGRSGSGEKGGTEGREREGSGGSGEIKDCSKD